MMARTCFLIGLYLGVAAAAAVAQTNPAVDIERVRMLYVAAAYAEALAAMPGVPVLDGERARTDLEQYRALCLLALGREQQAVATVERLVRDNPLFVPPAGDTSPRLRSIVAGARSRLVPDMARQAYAEAKLAYEAKNGEAHAAFERALELIDSLPAGDKAGLGDLRLLAAEFLELSITKLRPSVPASPPISVAPATSEPAGQYVPPTAVREQLPPWDPPDNASRRTEYVGVLRISIGEDGRVQTATIVNGSHPAYDAAALNAAKQWRYKPATQGGQPVAAQKDIQIRLRPR